MLCNDLSSMVHMHGPRGFVLFNRTKDPTFKVEHILYHIDYMI